MNYFITKVKVIWGLWKRPILFLLRVSIGALFVFSGYTKLMQPKEIFEISINMYQLIPASLAPFVASVLPWIEFVFGSFFLLGYNIEMSSIPLVCLAVLFQIVLGQSLLRQLGLDDCGCYGHTNVHLTIYQSFCLDTALVLLITLLFSEDHHALALDNLFETKTKHG